MRRTAHRWLILVLAIASIPVVGQAQTNSWISPTRGYWDDYNEWSMGVSPSTNGQSVILVTNDASKTVTIDSVTAGVIPGIMTVSNLVLAAPTGSTNTLVLSEVGTNKPLRILSTFTIANGGALYLTNSALVVDGSSNDAFSADGIIVMDGNSRIMVSPALYLGLESNAVGGAVLRGGQLLLTNSAPSAVGVDGVGQMIVSNGLLQSSSGFFFVGSWIGSQGSLIIAARNCVLAPYCRLVVGMETGAVGMVSVTGGNLIVTNSFITLVGGDGAGELDLLGGTNMLGPLEVGGNPGSQGTMTIAGGSNTFLAGVMIGESINATGTVWMTGGQVLATNLTTCVADWGYGVVTVSNGAWLGSTMLVGLRSVTLKTNQYGQVLVPSSSSYGTVNVNGGSMTLLTKLVIGNCTSGGVGVVNVAGGNLYVTNATHNAFIDVRSGQLNLSGGLLQTDILIMTNACGQFIHGGGTLIISNVVDGIPSAWKQQYGLDPSDPTVTGADPDGDGFTNLQEYQAGTDPTNSASSLRITSIVTQGNDISISWSVATGKAYSVQMATSPLTNAFGNLATVVVPATPMITGTNYLDAGAATNVGSRFYRIKLVPPP